MFRMKGLLIVLVVLAFAGFVSAYSSDSLMVSGGESSDVAPTPVLATTLVLSPNPIPVPQRPVRSAPVIISNLGLGSGGRGSDLSTSDVKVVLGGFRTYDFEKKKWRLVPKTKEWKERFVTSWAAKGNKLGVVRVDGTVFFNQR